MSPFLDPNALIKQCSGSRYVIETSQLLSFMAASTDLAWGVGKREKIDPSKTLARVTSTVRNPLPWSSCSSVYGMDVYGDCLLLLYPACPPRIYSDPSHRLHIYGLAGIWMQIFLPPQSEFSTLVIAPQWPTIMSHMQRPNFKFSLRHRQSSLLFWDIALLFIQNAANTAQHMELLYFHWRKYFPL